MDRLTLSRAFGLHLFKLDHRLFKLIQLVFYTVGDLFLKVPFYPTILGRKKMVKIVGQILGLLTSLVILTDTGTGFDTILACNCQIWIYFTMPPPPYPNFLWNI